jgi:hypothetical protein
MTKTGDLRKDKPDSVTGLSPGPQLSDDRVIDALLCIEKAVEVVVVAHKLSAANHILSKTMSWLAMLDCKAGRSYSASSSLLPGRLASV